MTGPRAHLGVLTPKQGRPKELEGELAWSGGKLRLEISADDKSIEDATSLAEEVISSLSLIDERARVAIAADLLATYNSGWNEYDRPKGDGTFETVRNPKLSAESFSAHFKLKSLSICGDCCVSLWYDDGGLFWGHSIEVVSFGGAKFTEPQAQLYG